MKRRVLALMAAGLLAGTIGCGSSTKTTVPTEMGPPIGDDSSGGSGGSKQKSNLKEKKSKAGESASDG